MDFIQMQAEQIAWSEKNFGQQQPYRPLLGMIEELCELQIAWDAKDKFHIIDAVGDVGIYMLDFCGKKGWALDEFWQARARAPWHDAPYYNVVPSIMRLAHSQLKGEQNIRGGSEQHDEAMRAVLRNVLRQLEEVASSVGSNFPDIIEAVWAKVSKRDWTTNPNSAHEVAEQSSGVGGGEHQEVLDAIDEHISGPK